MLAQDFQGLFNASRREGVILSFGGDLSENVLFSLGEVLKVRMGQDATNSGITKRVFGIFVEQAQNIIRYSADKVSRQSASGGLISAGMIVVGVDAERFYVVCGNEVPDRDVPVLRGRLDQLATMTGDELKAFYREKLRQPPDEGSLGGSIGLIEIARRSSAPVEYDFQELGDGRSFFCLKAYI